MVKSEQSYFSYLWYLRGKYRNTKKIETSTIKQLIILFTFLTIVFLVTRNIYGANLQLDKILDDLYEGVLNGVQEKLGEATTWIYDTVFNEFPHDMSYFYQRFGGVDGNQYVGQYAILNIVKPIKTMAFIFINVLFVFHLVVCATGNLVEQKNTPLVLTIRYLIVSFVVANADKIANYLMTYTTMLITEMNTLAANIEADLLTSASTTSTYTSMFAEMGASGLIKQGFLSAIAVSPIGAIFIICLWIAIIINIIKLILEIFERYIVVCLLNLCMPLGTSFWVSRTTSNISESYFRMYLSQLFLFVFSFISINCSFILLIGLIKTDILSLFFVLAFLRTAQKIDSLMGSLGLNVAHTSGSLFDDVGAAARSLGGLATGLQRGARTIDGAKQSILDGNMLRALKNNDFDGYMKAAGAAGFSDTNGAKGYFNNGGRLTGSLSSDAMNKAFGGWMAGQGINGTPELASSIAQMKFGDALNGAGLDSKNLSNVHFGDRGTMTGDYQGLDGNKQRLRLASSPLSDGTRIQDADGNSWYMKLDSSENNDGKAIQRPLLQSELGGSAFNDEPDSTSNTHQEQSITGTEDVRGPANDTRNENDLGDINPINGSEIEEVPTFEEDWSYNNSDEQPHAETFDNYDSDESIPNDEPGSHPASEDNFDAGDNNGQNTYDDGSEKPGNSKNEQPIFNDDYRPQDEGNSFEQNESSQGQQSHESFNDTKGGINEEPGQNVSSESSQGSAGYNTADHIDSSIDPSSNNSLSWLNNAYNVNPNIGNYVADRTMSAVQQNGMVIGKDNDNNTLFAVPASDMNVSGTMLPKNTVCYPDSVAPLTQSAFKDTNSPYSSLYGNSVVDLSQNMTSETNELQPGAYRMQVETKSGSKVEQVAINIADYPTGNYRDSAYLAQFIDNKKETVKGATLVKGTNGQPTCLIVTVDKKKDKMSKNKG